MTIPRFAQNSHGILIFFGGIGWERVDLQHSWIWGSTYGGNRRKIAREGGKNEELAKNRRKTRGRRGRGCLIPPLSVSHTPIAPAVGRQPADSAPESCATCCRCRQTPPSVTTTPTAGCRSIVCRQAYTFENFLKRHIFREFLEKKHIFKKKFLFFQANRSKRIYSIDTPLKLHYIDQMHWKKMHWNVQPANYFCSVHNLW